MLSLGGSPHELRNLAIALPLAADGPELGRVSCRYPVQIEVASGTVTVLTALPEFTLTPNGLTLNGAFTGAAGIAVSWDFGDGTALAQGATIAHTYARPGRYEVLTRLVKDQKLVEYRSAVVISAHQAVVAPLIVTPVLTASAAGSEGAVTLSLTTAPSTIEVSIDAAAGLVRGWAETGAATLKLMPGTYQLDFRATRKLSARFYSRQRYLPAAAVPLSRGRISTNRTFDIDSGNETTTALNPFGTQLFRNGSSAVTLSPVDRWTLELPLAENPWFLTVSSSDVAEFDGGEIADAVLTLEFMGAA
jgi:hypothetical protein